MPAKSTDAMGQVTQNKYDGQNRLIEKIDALGRKTRYGYDDRSNVNVVIDPMGRITSMTYDLKWNKVSSITRYNDPAPLGQAKPIFHTM
jgi:YD repeat-containing protein